MTTEQLAEKGKKEAKKYFIKYYERPFIMHDKKFSYTLNIAQAPLIKEIERLNNSLKMCHFNLEGTERLVMSHVDRRKKIKCLDCKKRLYQTRFPKSGLGYPCLICKDCLIKRGFEFKDKAM